MFRQSLNLIALLLMLSLSVSSIGCRTARNSYQPGSVAVDSSYLSEFQSTDYLSAGHSSEIGNVESGPQSVDHFIQIGLSQNPQIQEAELLVESLAQRIPQAASLSDPVLGATAFPSPVQTAAGEQEFALSLKQKVPWRGKRATKAAIAKEDFNAAQLRLSELRLKIVKQIKNTYYNLHFIEQSIAITERDRKQLEVIENVVNQLYRVKRSVTQQDVLQVQVSRTKIDTDLVQLKQQRQIAEARLVRLVHLPPESKVETLSELSSGKSISDLDALYQKAIESRPDLHAQLATIQRDRNSVQLAKLQSYPDMTFGFNWISTSTSGISPVANGDDSLLLTVGMNLPVYRSRIDAAVREAHARELSNTKKYDRLKDEIVEEITISYSKINSLQQTLKFFQSDIIPKQEITLKQSIDDYQVGKVDFLQLINNWRQLLQYHIQEKRLETDLRIATSDLARQLGEFSLPAPSEQEVPSVDVQSNPEPEK